MQIVEGSQNPTQWSQPSHPGSLWSLAILYGPLWCFPGPLRSPAVPCGVYSHPHVIGGIYSIALPLRAVYALHTDIHLSGVCT